MGLGTAPGYILKSPHSLALPSSRAKLRAALNASHRGIHFAGLGASPAQPITDQQYNASMDSPGASRYMRVDTIQCALNAVPGVTQLLVDGRWGPRTAAAFQSFVHAVFANPPAPPASLTDFAYVHPTTGATMISMTNALHDALLEGIDTADCVVAAATGLTPGAITPHPSNPTTSAPAVPLPAASSGGTDWTTYGIVAAGVVAAGVVGYAVFGGKKRKKGRR